MKPCSSELRKALMALVDADSDQGNFEHLSELLRNDPEARAYYRHFMDLHARLLLLHEGIPESLGSDSQDIASGNRLVASIPEEKCRRFPHFGTRYRPVEWAAIGCALLIAFLVGRQTINPGADAQSKLSLMSPQTPAPNGADVFVARLVNNTGSVISTNSGRLLEDGSKIKQLEILSVVEGFAQIELDSGSILNIEGPAAVSISDRGAPVLQYGKVYVKLPWGKRPFAVETAMGSVQLDGDDAVGIELLGSDIQVHVFSGEVQIEPFDQLDGPYLVPRGFAKRFYRGPSGELRPLAQKFTPDAFPSRLSLSFDQLAISHEYVALVEKSSPVSYWRFEESVDGFIENEVPDGVRCQLGGAARLVEQAGNHVVEIGFGPNSGYVISDGVIDSLADSEYTVETWVKPSHVHWATGIALARRRSASREEEGHAFLLELQGARYHKRIAPQIIRFLHRSPPGPSSLTGTSCYSSDQYEIRKWQHVVAVKDRSRMKLYLNGKLSAVERDNTSMVDDLTLVVGQIFSFDSVRPFSGQIDELAIYDHALTAEDVAAHFNAARNTGASASRYFDRAFVYSPTMQ